MFQFPHIHLHVFAKAPVLGTVKTRLQPAYPQEFSLSLHCTLVDYCLTRWQAAQVCPLQLCLAGDSTFFYDKLPQWQSLAVVPQQGDDLGERLLHSVRSRFANDKAEAVLLVGTDCPFIDKPYLHAACEAMAKYDVVIGGADDGGYVLLGLNQLAPTLFENIDWGSEYVYEQTITAIEQAGLSYFVLPVLSDIDRPDDLQKLTCIEALSHYAQA